MSVNKVDYYGTTLIDLTNDTVTPEVLRQGYTAHKADGSIITGTMIVSTQVITVEDTEDEHGGTVRTITAVDISNDTVTADKLLSGYTAHDSQGNAITGTYTSPTYQTKTVTPTKSSQIITPDTGYNALSGVTVNAIPNEYIIPSGSITITKNGINDVTNYSSVTVDVRNSSINLQSKNASISTSEQTITSDTGYDGLSSVTIEALSLQSKTVNPSNSIQVIEPSSSYHALSSVTVNAIQSGSAGTPDTTISTTPTISINSSGLITVSVSSSQSVTPTVSEGYVSEGTSGTISVSGSNTHQLTTKAATTITPTTSSQQAVGANVYTTGIITVGPIPSNYVDASTLATYYTGSTDPSSSLGNDGDIYLKTT